MMLLQCNIDKLICSVDVSTVKGRKAVAYYARRCFGQILGSWKLM